MHEVNLKLPKATYLYVLLNHRRHSGENFLLWSPLEPQVKQGLSAQANSRYKIMPIPNI